MALRKPKKSRNNARSAHSTTTCVFTPAIGIPLEVCPKNEVGSKVSVWDQIETEAVMRL